jgi:protein required for attachment to host cells
MKPTITWIAATDSERMKIFTFVTQDNQPMRFLQIQERVHPASALKNSELTTDDSGHFKIMARSAAPGKMTGSKYEPKYDAHLLEAMHFAKEVAELLEHERMKGRFDKLILCAADHFCGLIKKELTPALTKATTIVRKGYTKLPIKEFEAVAIKLVKPKLTSKAATAIAVPKAKAKAKPAVKKIKVAAKPAKAVAKATVKAQVKPKAKKAK